MFVYKGNQRLWCSSKVSFWSAMVSFWSAMGRLLLFILMSWHSVLSAQRCPSTEDVLWQGHCYSFHYNAESWMEARTTCGEKSTSNMTFSLVVVNSADENEFVYSSLKTKGIYLISIGYMHEAHEDVFTWVDGSTHVYTNWAPGEPNNVRNVGPQNQHCVYLMNTVVLHGKWNDGSCSLDSPYVCEGTSSPQIWIEDTSMQTISVTDDIEKQTVALIEDMVTKRPKRTTTPTTPTTPMTPKISSTPRPIKTTTVERAIVTSVGPNVGPVSGGTDIPFRGFNLEGTRPPQVKIGNCHCITKFANNTLIMCTTPRGLPTLVNTTLGIYVSYIDGRTLNKTMNETFTYKDNPTILSVYPLTSILSGGVMLNVTGTGLDVVGKPKLSITVAYDQVPKYVFESTCSVYNSTLMHCPTPKMDIFNRTTDQLDFDSPKPPTRDYSPYCGAPTRQRRSVSGYSAVVIGKLGGTQRRSRRDLPSDKAKGQINNQTIKFFIGLNLDGFRKYRNLSEEMPKYSELTVYIDPIIHPWGEEKEVRIGYTQLEVKGQRLTVGIRNTDYKMVIGQSECEKLDVYDNNLVCTAPEAMPRADPRDTTAGKFNVRVYIGSLKAPFSVGSVTYHISFWDQPANKWSVIGACVICGILLLILAAFFVARRTTTAKHDIQLQNTNDIEL